MMNANEYQWLRIIKKIFRAFLKLRLICNLYRIFHDVPTWHGSLGSV